MKSETLGETDQELPVLVDGEQMSDERHEELCGSAAADEQYLSDSVTRAKESETIDEQDVPSQSIIIIKSEPTDENEIRMNFQAFALIEGEPMASAEPAAQEEIITDLAREETSEQYETQIVSGPKKPKNYKRLFNYRNKKIGLALRRKRETPEQLEKRMLLIARVNLGSKERRVKNKIKWNLMQTHICDTYNTGRARAAREKRASCLAAEKFFKTLKKPPQKRNKFTAERNEIPSRNETPEDVDCPSAEVDRTRSAAELESEKCAGHVMAEESSTELSEDNWCAEFDEKLRKRAMVILDRGVLPSSSSSFGALTAKCEINDEPEAQRIEMEASESSAVENIFCGKENPESAFETAGKELGKVTEKAEDGKSGVGIKRKGGWPRKKKPKSGINRKWYVTVEERKIRDERNKLARQRRFENKTPEQREKRLEAIRKREESETNRQRYRRRRLENIHWKKKIASETAEQHENHLAVETKMPEEGGEEQMVVRKESETKEERKERYRLTRNEKIKAAREKETEEEREKRRAAARLAWAERKKKKKMGACYEQMYVYLDNAEDDLPRSSAENHINMMKMMIEGASDDDDMEVIN